MEVAPSSKPGYEETLMHKNKLQEYAQRSSLPLPLYQTVNEGLPHSPQFRSTVLVDGVIFRSPTTFFHRKEAEQDVAKMALEGISKKIKQERFPLVHAVTMFCKSILHEYAVKRSLDRPRYTTSKSDGRLPEFISSVELDGKIYKGASGRSKKQAEQLAARTAIESILGNCDSSMGILLSQIIKSKEKLYATIPLFNVSRSSPGINALSGGNSDNLLVGKEAQVASTTELSPVTVHGVACTSGQLSEGKQREVECTFELNSGPIRSEIKLQPQPQGGPPPLQQVSRCSQTDSLLVGKEAQVDSTTEISPVAVHGVVCTSGQLSEGKQEEVECTFELNSQLIGSEIKLKPQPQGGPTLRQVSTCSQTDSLLVGKEAQVVSTAEISPVAVHGVVCTSGRLSEGKQQEVECAFELDSGLIGSGIELQALPQGGLPLQQVSTRSQIDPGEFLSQVTKEGLAVGPSGFLNETHGTQSNSKRKRPRKGKKK